jgi:ferredoxin
MAERAPSGVLRREGLQALIDALGAEGYTVLAPTVRDGAIVVAPVDTVDALPTGQGDLQEPGRYRLRPGRAGALFDQAVPATAWKRFLHPPDTLLFRARRTEAGFAVTDGPPPAPRQAFLGVRACDAAAIAIQDAVFMADAFRDPVYAARRDAAFIVALTCGRAAATCFCAALGSGPAVRAPHDLALTEIAEGEGEGAGFVYLVEAASDGGAALLARLPAAPATADHFAARDAIVAATTAAQARGLPADYRGLLARHLEDSHWQAVAERCLSCGNCTMACPTCFCATVEDTTSLDGQEATRRRLWDSCFSLEFSYIHGGFVRQETASRYRQWITHKLSTWFDQFGRDGCVGCGRCITWCPVGIDITEETAALAAKDDRAAR